MRLLLCACAAFVLSAAAQAPARPDKGGGSRAKGEDSFFSGPPFTLRDLLPRIGVIADKRLRTAVDRRGIHFSPSSADLDKLKQAGASAELIQIISRKAPPKPAPAPATPPPTRAGKVSLQCVPAECDVVVNGKPHGSTSNGAVELTGLPTGENVIDFRKEGYEGQQLVLSLRAGAATSQTITLRPTAVTRARFGAQVLDRMLAKLGGKPALQKPLLVSASGSASLFQSGGQRTEWQFTSRLKLPAMAAIEISAAKMKWWTSLKGDDAKGGGARQMAGGPVAKEMETLVRVYRDYQLALLADRWKAMNPSAPSDLPVNGQLHLRAGNNDGTYQVDLDADATPRRVVYEPASGPGAGMEVLYADFAAIDQIWYPKSMVIKFPGQQQHGLELQFKEIAFPGKLADKELHR